LDVGTHILCIFFIITNNNPSKHMRNQRQKHNHKNAGPYINTKIPRYAKNDVHLLAE